MIPLTNEERKLQCDQKICNICKNYFSANNKKYQRVTDHCHYTEKYREAAHDICNLKI